MLVLLAVLSDDRCMQWLFCTAMILYALALAGSSEHGLLSIGNVLRLHGICIFRCQS